MGRTPPRVGVVGRNEKYNEKEKSAPNGVTAAHGPFRLSVRHHSETTYS